MRRRGSVLLAELTVAAVLSASLIGIVAIQLRLDALSMQQEARSSELEVVRNLLERARRGQDPEPPSGWRWERRTLTGEGIELVALVANDGRRFETLRRGP